VTDDEDPLERREAGRAAPQGLTLSILFAGLSLAVAAGALLLGALLLRLSGGPTGSTGGVLVGLFATLVAGAVGVWARPWADRLTGPRP
jgi:hypothetical protein